jgi:hypothetical protein
MGDIEKGLKGALNIATLGLSDSLFSTPDMPEIKDPAVAPDPESLEERRKLQKGAARRKGAGRTSTILSESNTLG